MVQLFAENLLPIFLAAGVGYLVAARSNVSARPLAHVAFYVFAPCLIFQIITDNHVTGYQMLRVGGFTALSLVLLGGVTALIGWRLGWTRPMIAAATLVVLLPNAGNFGLSANLLAFGPTGLAQASLYFVTSSILSYTLGVFIASMGRVPLGRSLVGLLKIPTIWAILVAFGMVRVDAALPFPVERTVRLLAQACIPVFLVVLGMQLHGAAWRQRVGPLALVSGLRLGASVGLALVLAGVFGLEGPARQAGILQSAMPSAVITIILATEYDVEPGFVTAAVLVTTVLSPVTLTPLLGVLGA